MKTVLFSKYVRTASLCLYQGLSFKRSHLTDNIQDNLYFLQRIPIFWIRFGIKGPVYLRDKDGKTIVPMSLISRSEGDGEIS